MAKHDRLSYGYQDGLSEQHRKVLNEQHGPEYEYWPRSDGSHAVHEVERHPAIPPEKKNGTKKRRLNFPSNGGKKRRKKTVKKSKQRKSKRLSKTLKNRRKSTRRRTKK